MTSDYIEVASFTDGYNLAPLLVHFTEHGISYRIERSEDGQALWVAEAQADKVRRFLAKLHGDEHDGEEVDPIWVRMKSWPVTMAIIGLGVVGYLIARFDPGLEVIRFLSYVEYDVSGNGVVPHSFENSVILSGQWWRLVTPAFLHFSAIHIIFTSLAIWELGRRLELFFGKVAYLFLFVLIVQVSNFIEYWYSKSALFGGLSGAAFGFLGLLGVLSWRTKSPVLKMPVAIYVITGIWALISMTDIVNKLFGVQMTNGAHIGGFVVGILIGYLLPVKRKTS